MLRFYLLKRTELFSLVFPPLPPLLTARHVRTVAKDGTAVKTKGKPVAYTYSPRGMPARFMEGAPEIVRKNVLDIIAIKPAAPLDFDVLLRPDPADMVDMHRAEITGLDFGCSGARGCHFFLRPRDLVGYRDRNRRKRVAWADLPEATRKAIVAYLEWNPEEV